MEEAGDLSKLKVAELKKQLKNRGLLVTGNKTELVERLQKAKESDGSQGLDNSGGLDDEEFDEEEILAGDDAGDITPQEEAAALAGGTTIKVKSASSLTAQPGKKKISLKRSEPTLTTAEEVSSPSKEGKKESEPSTNSTAKEETPTGEPKHKVIKLSSDTEPAADSALEARAKKFGVTAPPSEETAKSARAARFGSNSSDNKKPAKLSMETGGTDMEKLKKRAERFGEVTSKSLSKLEGLEKMKQRQSRFGEATPEAEKKIAKITDPVSKEAAAARAEKFGTKTTNGTAASPKKTVGDDDAKLKRAERFAK